MRGNVVEVINHLKNFAPEIARREHIRIAREGLERVKSKSPDVPYRIIVDGKAAFSEEQVKPFGVIKYVFIRLPQITRFAILTAQDLSPVESGRYKKSWILIVDGKPFFSLFDLPNNAKEIIVVNFQPYARKIHVRGARIRQVPPGIVEKVRQLTRRRFGSQANLDMRFIELQGGWVLRRDYVQIRKSGRRRLHTRAGREITYPALIITPKE